MKKTFLRMSLAFIVGAGLVLTGCKGKEGCTDGIADNYDEEVKEKNDDGSCMYSAKVVFWYKEAVAQEFQNYENTATMKLYIDGKFVGSQASSQFFTSQPECNTNNVLEYEQNIGGSSTKSYSYSIKDEEDYEWFTGTVNLEAEYECTAIELVL